MLTRRSFLTGVSLMTLSQALSGCEQGQSLLDVLLLQDSIPLQLVSQFRNSLVSGQKVSFKIESQLKDLFQLLEDWQKKPPTPSSLWNRLPIVGQQNPTLADLITLGDSWLEKAIQQQLIEPLTLDQLSGWQNLPPRWQQLVRRNDKGYLDENGQIWGAPYRWGYTMIVYRRDRFRDLGWTPQDWNDLWRKELASRLSVVDQPREIIGLTLKKLGYSYNTLEIEKIPDLKSELISFNRQVRYYSSQYYLQPLVIGDTWAAVGWSNDIIPLVVRNPNLAAVIPQSGTALWTDIWVKPTNSSQKKNDEQLTLAQQWIDFCWQPKAANEISLFTHNPSPIILSLKLEQVAKDVKDNPLLLSNPEILAKSDFLEPLPANIWKQYINLWKEIRQKVKV